MFGLMPWRRERMARELTPRTEIPFRMMHRELSEWFDRLTARWPMPGEWVLPKLGGLELEEFEKEYVVKAELPGFETNEIEVFVNGEVLTIKAEHTEPSKEKQANEALRPTLRLHETMLLPSDAEREKVEANYRNGLLEVHLAKKPEAKGRRIEVKT